MNDELRWRSWWAMTDVAEISCIHSLMHFFSPWRFAAGLAPEWQTEKQCQLNLRAAFDMLANHPCCYWCLDHSAQDAFLHPWQLDIANQEEPYPHISKMKGPFNGKKSQNQLFLMFHRFFYALMPLHKASVAHGIFYAQTLLHTGTFTHRCFGYRSFDTENTEQFSHIAVFTQSRYTEQPLHTEVCTQRNLCTKQVLHREAVAQSNFYTRTPWHKAVFPHRNPYTEQGLWHIGFF